MSAKRTFGAASRSAPSLRWNSSRCSSGTSPTSRKLITCPSFIAAPFIVPSAVTICSAASRWRRSSAALLALLASARGWSRACPSWRAAWPGGEARHPRGAGDPRGGDPVLGHLGSRRRRPAWPRSAAGVAGRRAAAAVAVGGRRGRRRRGRRSSRSASASRSPSAVAVSVGVGGRGGGRRRRGRRRSCRRTARRALGVADGVAEDGELGRGDDARRRSRRPAAR